MHRVFTYGTLKTGQPNHYFMTEKVRYRNFFFFVNIAMEIPQTVCGNSNNAHSVADPGFPRSGGASPGGRQHTILPNFPKNCMQLKKLDRGEGVRPSRPPQIHQWVILCVRSKLILRIPQWRGDILNGSKILLYYTTSRQTEICSSMPLGPRNYYTSQNAPLASGVLKA